jgi:hypothetical protein
LLSIEGDTGFPNLFDVSSSLDVLGRIAFDEDKIGPQPWRDSSTIGEAEAVAFADVAETNAFKGLSPASCGGRPSEFWWKAQSIRSRWN